VAYYLPHARGIAGWARRIVDGRIVVITIIAPVLAPFSDVAVHIVEPEGVGRERADGGRVVPYMQLGANIGLAAV
jgi:hypothetical protein